MKKLIITLFTLLLFVTGSYAQELNSKIKQVQEGENSSTSEIKKEEIPKVSTFARMNNFSSFKAGDIVYDTNLEAHYQYLGESTWILSDKFSPKKASSYLAQLSTFSTLSGAPTLNAAQAAAGEVAFYNGPSSITSSASLFWDRTNNRLGISNSSPQYPLDVVGQIYADSLNINGIYIGRGRGRDTTSTAVGRNALSSNTRGSYNTANGFRALNSNTTGSKNISLGYFAGNNLTSGNNNIAIGSEIWFPSATGSNQLVIANSIFGTNIYDNQNANIGIRTDSPTAALDINGSLRIRGGAPAAGKVLTTDANGNASWGWAGANATVNRGDYALLIYNNGFYFNQFRTSRVFYGGVRYGTSDYTTAQGISLVALGGNDYAFQFTGTKYEMQIVARIGGTSNQSGNINFTLAPTTSTPNTYYGTYYDSSPIITNVPMTVYSTAFGTNFTTEWKTIYVQPNTQYSLFLSDFIGNVMKVDEINILFKKIY